MGFSCRVVLSAAFKGKEIPKECVYGDAPSAAADEKKDDAPEAAAAAEEKKESAGD